MLNKSASLMPNIKTTCYSTWLLSISWSRHKLDSFDYLLAVWLFSTLLLSSKGKFHADSSATCLLDRANSPDSTKGPSGFQVTDTRFALDYPKLSSYITDRHNHTHLIFQRNFGCMQSPDWKREVSLHGSVQSTNTSYTSVHGR